MKRKFIITGPKGGVVNGIAWAPHSVVWGGERGRPRATSVEVELHKSLEKAAKLLMDLGQGEDVHTQAYRLVKSLFPDLYESYQ